MWTLAGCPMIPHPHCRHVMLREYVEVFRDDTDVDYLNRPISVDVSEGIVAGTAYSGGRAAVAVVVEEDAVRCQGVTSILFGITQRQQMYNVRCGKGAVPPV